MPQGPSAFAASPGQLGRSALWLSGDHNDDDHDGQDDDYHDDDNDDFLSYIFSVSENTEIIHLIKMIMMMTTMIMTVVTIMRQKFWKLSFYSPQYSGFYFFYLIIFLIFFTFYLCGFKLAERSSLFYHKGGVFYDGLGKAPRLYFK